MCYNLFTKGSSHQRSGRPLLYVEKTTRALER